MEHHHLFRGKINYKGAIFNSKLFNYQRIKLTKQNWGLGTWGYPSNLDVESLILDRNQWNSDTWGDARELNPTYLLVNYHKFGKSHFFSRENSLHMAVFNGYVKQTVFFKVENGSWPIFRCCWAVTFPLNPHTKLSNKESSVMTLRRVSGPKRGLARAPWFLEVQV